MKGVAIAVVFAIAGWMLSYVTSLLSEGAPQALEGARAPDAR
jgi:hypothetical protein